MSGRLPWVSVAAVLVFLALWEGIAQSGRISPVLLSAPSRILRHALTADPALLLADVRFTLRVFALGLLSAVGVGVGLGVLTATSTLADQLTAPFVVTLNALPKIVLMPLIVLWLGIGAGSNIFLAALMGSFPILMATQAGIRSVDRGLLLLGRTYGASRLMIWRRILLPAISPYLLAGLRVAISYAMVGTLIAEFFASSQGVGYRMVLLMSNFHIDGFFLHLMLIAGFTLLCTGAIAALERRVEGWRPPAFQRPGL